MRKKEDEVRSFDEIVISSIKKGLLFLALILFISGAWYTVGAGHRGVLLTFGKPSMEARGEGLGFKIPIVQRVKDLEVRTQKVVATADSASNDLQDVQTSIALNFHIEPSSAPRLYQEIGVDYNARVIQPSIQEAVKAVTATYKAEELVTKRPMVKEDIRKLLTEKLQPYYLVVDDFNIVNFQFSEEFDKAIEQKVTAEQLKLKAERDLERIKIEKEQIITQAEAEARSLELQRQVVTPELVELRKIEMMREAIAKWNGKMPEATSGMPFIDITPKGVGE